MQTNVLYVVHQFQRGGKSAPAALNVQATRHKSSEQAAEKQVMYIFVANVTGHFISAMGIAIIDSAHGAEDRLKKGAKTMICGKGE